MFWSKITITCFAASYLVALGLEASRLFFRLPVRLMVIALFSAAGLFAHASFLVWRAPTQVEQQTGVVPFSSWFDWCLITALALAGVYFGMMIRHPQNAVGLFILPLVLLFIGVATYVRDTDPFSRSTAMSVAGTVHGIALLVGTVVVLLGFAAGIMYLIQSNRLKHRLPPRQGFRLPSLETLQKLNRQALFWSTFLLLIGLLSGIVLNLQHRAGSGVSWTDPVVVSSGVLFLWLMTASIFEWVYRPARQGRKVAYLTLASFVFLALALGFVLLGRHGSKDNDGGPQPTAFSWPSERQEGRE